MENTIDICRICNMHINKNVLIKLFSIEVNLHYEYNSPARRYTSILPTEMKIPIFSCGSCINKTDDLLKLMKNADITLKAIFQDNNFITDVSKFEIIPLENLLESSYENDDYDYTPSKSKRKVKRKRTDESESVTIPESCRQTRSTVKKACVENIEHQNECIENKTVAESNLLFVKKEEIDIDIDIDIANEDDDNSANCDDLFTYNDSEVTDIDDINETDSNFCNYCNESVDNYKEHKKKFHNGKRYPFSCIVCRGCYPTAYELYKHQFSMHRPYVGGECNVCKKHYTNLVHHNWKCHEGELCFQCGKTFQSKRQFSNHVTTHHTGFKHFCHICNKGFKKPAHLKNHLELHDEDCKEKCSTCGKEFFGKQRLKVHEKTHIVERKSTKSDAVETIATEKHSFKCPFCTLSFICLESLQKHSTYHRIEEKNTEIYKHVCQFCSQRFKRSDHKQIHEDAVHRKILPFKCETCGVKFVKQNFLTYHIKKTHSGVKFQCSMCPKSFTLASTLRRHENNLHFDLAKCNCSVCGKEMKNTRYLLAHLKTHTYDEEKEAAERFYEELLSKQKGV